MLYNTKQWSLCWTKGHVRSVIRLRHEFSEKQIEWKYHRFPVRLIRWGGDYNTKDWKHILQNESHLMVMVF
jgi:hypothetical protein